ncbi:MarR family transcriptional regulator [Aeromicrobium sp. CF4.19]|uniref:SCO6745 family protein n=1 Tax=Aeromicrobium sp. CF4.19 TaxID=3373082 RepID=UPI003EE4F904
MADSALTPFWRAVNTVHAVVYFAPDAKERYEALGLKGYWMGYFASRGAALGTPGPELVTATFHGFSPAIVARALPDAWSMADRDAVLAERAAVAADALRPGLADHDIAAMTTRLAGAAKGLDVAGKPLAAAQLSLTAPADPVQAFWHHLTVLREFRGDCHVGVLVAAGLSGTTSNVLQVAVGKAPEHQRQLRGWTEQEWAAAVEDVRNRGWVDADGAATESGRVARERLEDATDRSCEAFMDRESTAHAVAVSDALRAAARAVLESGVVAFPNPTGNQRP